MALQWSLQPRTRSQSPKNSPCHTINSSSPCRLPPLPQNAAPDMNQRSKTLTQLRRDGKWRSAMTWCSPTPLLSSTTRTQLLIKYAKTAIIRMWHTVVALGRHLGASIIVAGNNDDVDGDCQTNWFTISGFWYDMCIKKTRLLLKRRWFI